MILKKIIIWALLLGVLIAVSLVYRLPTKLLLGITPYLLQKKYGLQADIDKIEGGFQQGLILDGVRLFKKNGEEFLYCSQIITSVRLQEIFLPQPKQGYSICLQKPELLITYPLAPAYLPPWTNFNVEIHDARLTVTDTNKTFSLTINGFSGKLGKEGNYLKLSFMAGNDFLNQQTDVLAEIKGRIDLRSSQGSGILILKNYPLNYLKPKFYDADFSDGKIDLELELINNTLLSGFLQIKDGKLCLPNKDVPPLEFNGQISLDSRGAQIKQCSLSLGDIKLGLNGKIARNREMDLEIFAPGTGSKFFVRGSPEEPKVFTHWGPLQTVFHLQGTKYMDNALIFPQINGQIKLPGFIPFNLQGGMIVSSKEIKFQNVILADSIAIQGDLSRQSTSRLKFLLNNVKGEKLADKFPAALRPFIDKHMIDGQIIVYGNIDDLNASGKLRVFSYPLEIVCRYRGRNFSFRSVADRTFHLSGSFKWEEVPQMKVKGVCQQMELKDLLSLFIKNVSAECQGQVDGELILSGDPAQPLIRAKLEIKNGKIRGIEFDVAYLNLEWKGGVFEIQHSMIYYKDIPGRLKGYIDPKSTDFFGNIEIEPFGDSFLWKGLNVKKDTLQEAIVFGRQLGENVSVKFKSPMSSDPAPGAVEAEPELELEYKIKDDKNILIKMEEDEGTVGIEHKTKF